MLHVEPSVRARPRIDGLVAIGLSAAAGSLTWAAPLEVGLATALVLLALARKRAPLIAVCSAIAFFGTAARASHTISTYERERAHVLGATRWPARCVVRGTVSKSPIALGDAFKIDVDVTRAECNEAILAGRITLHLPVDAAPSLARGDEIQAIAQLAPGHRFWNSDTGDPRPAQALRNILLSGGADDVEILRNGRGISASVDRVRGRLRSRIKATFPSGTAAMARALVLGEDDLSALDRRAFRQSGLAHLLAVSGMHLVIIVVTFVSALQGLLARMPPIATRVAPARIAGSVGIPLAWAYADLAGGSGSAIRAAWMTSVALLANVLARRSDPWRAFGISVFGMVLFEPLVAFDLSFALSAAATAGLMGLGSRIARPALDRTPSWAAPIVRTLAASVAASLTCAPVLACMAADLPIAGLVANLVAIPLGEMAALPLCLGHALLEPFPLAESGCALAASGALSLVRSIARWFALLPGSTLAVPTPTTTQLAAIAVGACGLIPAVSSRPWRWITPSLLVVGVCEYAARARGSPTGSLRVTFLDVGQGDSAIVDFPDGSAMVIDGGGFVGSPVDTGERVLAPVLRARRRRAVAAAVLSHPHPDHFGGLRAGLASVKLGAFWDTGQGENEGARGEYAALLDNVHSRGARVLRPSFLCGSHEFGGAHVDVLAPCPDIAADRGANDNSFVIRIAYGERAFLFVGDAEHEEEAELLATSHSRLHADVLKVGHHGSRTSTGDAFLAAVDPSVAVISCGVRNRFGHPTSRTLTTLAASRAKVYRTDLLGSVTVTTNGQSLEASAAGSD